MSLDSRLKFLAGLELFRLNFSTGNIRALMSLAGDPHDAFPSIHIAGTNGKGTTAAMIAAILAGSGYKTGLYLSPHMETVRERISINGEIISKRDAGNIMLQLKTLVNSNLDLFTKPKYERTPSGSRGILSFPLTYFEFVTAMAFTYFARKKIDVAVIETGMGGRLDATNIISPMLSVLTSIGKDHTAWLGSTAPEIAREKCGIIKPGRAVVSHPAAGAVLRTIKKQCKSRGSRLHLQGDEFRVSDVKPDLNKMTLSFTYSADRKTPHSVTLPYSGLTQAQNAATAIRVSRILAHRLHKISRQAILGTLESFRLPGRFEFAAKYPLTVLDGAHNPDAMKNLIKSMAAIFPEKKLHLVIGMMADKDWRSALSTALRAKYLVSITLTAPESQRAWDLKKVKRYLAGKAPARCEVISIPSVSDAVKTARARAGKEDIVCVAGSFYILGPAKKVIRENRRKH